MVCFNVANIVVLFLTLDYVLLDYGLLSFCTNIKDLFSLNSSVNTRSISIVTARFWYLDFFGWQQRVGTLEFRSGCSLIP